MFLSGLNVLKNNVDTMLMSSSGSETEVEYDYSKPHISCRRPYYKYETH